MRNPILMAFTLAAVACLALVTSTAQAKGPFVVEVSGGDLSRPVMVPGVLDDVFANGVDLSAPALTRPYVYTVKLFDAQADPTTGQPLATLTYYPKQGDEMARVLSEGNYWPVQPTFAEKLDKVIRQATGAAALPSAGGLPVDDGSAFPWAMAAGAALALVSAGLVAGTRLVARRR